MDTSQRELDEQFLSAVEKGDVEGVRRLLKSNANVNARTSDIFDPKRALHMAAKSNNTQLVTVLLDAKCDANAKRSFAGQTALHDAAEAGSLESLQLLLARRADVNLEGLRGATPLFFAAEAGHLECVKALLGARSNINARDRSGESVLFSAAIAPTPALLELFIEANIQDVRGAGCQATGQLRRTLLHAALDTDRPNPRIVSLLLQLKCDINAKNDFSHTPFMVACGSGMEDEDAVLQCLEMLVAAKADTEAKDSDFCSALHLAARNSVHASVIRFLCERGIGGKVSDSNRFHSTPLEMLCLRAEKSNEAQIARALVDFGAIVQPVAYDSVVADFLDIFV